LRNITLSGTNIVFNGSNGISGMTFYVVSSTNVALPLSNWTRIWTNQFDASGGFTEVVTVDTNTPATFFSVLVP
jgi:hypothetical protein